MRIYTGRLIGFVASTYRRFIDRGKSRILLYGFLRKVAESLDEGHSVNLAELGTFKVIERREPKTRFGKPNPRAGQITRKVKFRTGSTLKRRLKR